MIDDHRRLGHSDVRVSAFGLGGAPLGGLFEPVDEDDAAEVVLAALRAGIGYIDTAPYYGFGESERRLGRILGAIDRSSFVISTKVGRLLESRPNADPDMFFGVEPADVVFDFSADGVRRSLAASLDTAGPGSRRHRVPARPRRPRRAGAGCGLPALERWRAEGVVGAIGVGMNQTAVPARFVRETDIDVVLLAGRWTLLDQSGLDDLLPLCAETGTSVVVGGVFNSGVLADPRAAPLRLRRGAQSGRGAGPAPGGGVRRRRYHAAGGGPGVPPPAPGGGFRAARHASGRGGSGEHAIGGDPDAAGAVAPIARPRPARSDGRNSPLTEGSGSATLSNSI